MNRLHVTALDDKNVTKKTIVSSVLVSFSIFANNSTRIQPGGPSPSIQFLPTNLNRPLQQYLNGTQFKWAPNNNIDPGVRDPFNLIFDKQIKWAPTITSQ